MPRVTPKQKLAWFVLGARSCAETVRSADTETYPCPLCRREFQWRAIDEGQLTAEDVPARSLGGRPLLLTCKACNNGTGAKVDADAKAAEVHRDILAGRRRANARATIGGVRVHGEVDLGSYKFYVDPKRNAPMTRERLGPIAGQTLSFNLKTPSELGRNISMLKAGYLTLVGEYGFKFVSAQGFDVVRRQILEPDERLAATWQVELPNDVDYRIRRIFRVLSPAEHRGGWAVQVGRFLLFYPQYVDTDFYQRIAALAGKATHTQLKLMSVPGRARFGQGTSAVDDAYHGRFDALA